MILNLTKKQFLLSRTPAFETLYGGQAGGGKSYGIVIEALKWIGEPTYSAILFRRTFPQLEGNSGLIDKSHEIGYRAFGGIYSQSNHTWTFPSGAKIRFAHLNNIKDYYDHQGLQYHFIGFDELTQFEEEQYRYLFSRIRKQARSGIYTRIISASNPGADWVLNRWRPWLDQAPIAKPGEILWFKLVGEEEVITSFEDPSDLKWSRTFIPASFADNPYLDREYLRNLDMLPENERQMLKYGNWHVAIQDRIITRWNSAYIKKYEPDKYSKFYHHYVFCDWGIRDKTYVGYGTYNFKEAKFYQQAESVFQNNTLITKDIALEIQGLKAKLWGDVNNIDGLVYRYIGDNNLQIINDMNIMYNLPFISTKKTDLHSMVNSANIFIDEGKFNVDPSCKEMIGALTSGTWDERRKEFKRSLLYGHYDALAALIYLILNLDLTTNPIPINYGFRLDNAYIPTEKDSGNLKNVFDYK